jgi:hypothetical protein
MMLQIKHSVAGCLGLSGLTLGLLVPGGPIETRSFSHLSPLTLGAFNTFLTTLVLGSLVLIYFVLRSERWAMGAATVCGLSYLGVYGLDLAVIFPVSPDAMPVALLAIEVWGFVLAFPLILLSIQAVQMLGQTTVVKMTVANAPALGADFSLLPMLTMVIFLGLGLIGLGIITFATASAMGL